jgi:hypothetical protein
MAWLIIYPKSKTEILIFYERRLIINLTERLPIYCSDLTSSRPVPMRLVVRRVYARSLWVYPDEVRMVVLHKVLNTSLQ